MKKQTHKNRARISTKKFRFCQELYNATRAFSINTIQNEYSGGGGVSYVGGVGGNNTKKKKQERETRMYIYAQEKQIGKSDSTLQNSFYMLFFFFLWL